MNLINKPMNRKTTLLTAATLTLAGAGTSWAQNSNADIEEVKRQEQSLQQQVETMKEGPRVDPETEGLLGQRFFKGKGLTIGLYGEAKYRVPETGGNSFDPHRFVLAPSYQINDWLVFNSELEFEHGGIDENPAD